ncbi:MAG: type II secretion system F family protein [Methanophagales archaeon ANME-1-THS]|nr:MAG: type II secretion system F family protein [Methanophagales archaeon ANME-1-THS]
MADEILEKLAKKKRKKDLMSFFRDPMGFIRANPVRLSYLSGALGGCLVLISYLTDLEFVAPYDAYILAGIVAFMPPAYYSYSEQKRIKKAEDAFPDLLRDLAQAKRAGLSLIDAVTLTTEGDYGVLTEGMRKIAAQLTWGVPIEDTLQMFAKRYPTRIIKRSIEMIIEGYKTGGEVGEVLKIAADDVMELKSLEKRRTADMSPYVMVCYVTFFVFLGVLLVLYHSFIPTMVEAGEAVAESGATGRGGVMIRGVDVETLKMLFFHCGIIQGVCSGLVAGKLGEGKVIAGLKHAIILASAAFGLFAILKIMPL